MDVCSLCGIALDGADSSCSRLGAPAVNREPDAIPKELEGRFLEPRVFAIGSTGTLYRVRDAERGREGLLKIVRPSLVSRGAERERLKRELVKQAALSQPHLLLPIDTGAAGPTLWLFRESLEGESLRLRFAAGETIATEEALAISAQLAAALDELHRAGLLHRDLHPGHVLLARGASGPTVRVIDAAIAAPLEQKGAVEVRGTPGFVAPEQLKGRLVSFRSDLYALGCVMYQLFAGRAPYTSESVEELLTAHAEAPLPTPPAGLPDDVRELLVALLAKDPRERPFSAQQVRRVLDRYLPETDAASGGGEERVHKETLVGLPIDELAKIAAPAKASPAPSSSKRPAEETDELAIPDILEEVPAAEVVRPSVRPSSPSVPPPPPPSIPPPMPQGRSVPPSPPSRAPGRKGPSLPPPVPSAGALPSLGLPSIPAASAPPPSLPPIPSGVASKPAPAVLRAPDAARASNPPPPPSAEPTMELDALLEGSPPALVPPPILDLPVGSSMGDIPAPSIPAPAVPTVEVVSPREPRSASAEAFHAPSALNIGFLFSIPSRIRRKPIASAAAALLVYAAFSTTSEDAAVDDPAAVSPVAFVEATPPPAVRSAPPRVDRRLARRADPPAPTPVQEPAPEVHVAAAAEPPATPVAEASPEEESASAIVASSSTARKASLRASSERAAPTPTVRAAPDGPSALDRLRDEARAHFRARRYARAASAYEKAIALDGTQAGLHAGLGAAKLALKEYRGAIAAYTQAVRLSPRHSGFHAALGRAYEQAGDRSKAAAAYKQALALDSGNGAAKQGLKRLGERS